MSFRNESLRGKMEKVKKGTSGGGCGAHSCSLNWKDCMLHWVTSEFNMERSVKLTLSSLSIRITVFVLNQKARKNHKVSTLVPRHGTILHSVGAD